MHVMFLLITICNGKIYMWKPSFTDWHYISLYTKHMNIKPHYITALFCVGVNNVFFFTQNVHHLTVVVDQVELNNKHLLITTSQEG